MSIVDEGEKKASERLTGPLTKEGELTELAKSSTYSFRALFDFFIN